ncbi:MAG: glycosyltransferase family 4 protein [Thermoanaerobaculia bacterium]|nr:glycosyltransferase family 4 protein [Thermoanaerobaculia bacterium]MBP9823677.1 glycosyltransferase family 4 protein [Thermoanaerobaculia bacterium]
MRVLFVNEKGWYFGGVEQLVDDTAAGLAARGHEPHLLSSEPMAIGRSGLAAAFTSRHLLELGGASSTWMRQLARALEVADPEVVYLHRWSHAASFDRLLAGRRVLRYVHDHDLYCPRRHKYFPLSTRICNHPLGWQCAVHGCLVSPEGPVPGLPGWIELGAKAAELARQRTLPALAAGSRWMVDMLVRNGFDAARVAHLPPVPAGLEREPLPPSDEPIVLYVGQVIRGKGVDLLLRALAEVRSDFRALIVGTGNHLQECIALTRELGLGGRVHFVGWVPHEVLPAYYARARVVAVPSRWPEPFGMVGLEAMWSCRAVVGFAVGGIPDWLADGETGIAAPEADWRALGHALEELLADPGLAERMGRAGYARARDDFRFDDYLERTAELLAGAGAMPADPVGAAGGPRAAS